MITPLPFSVSSFRISWYINSARGFITPRRSLVGTTKPRSLISRHELQQGPIRRLAVRRYILCTDLEMATIQSYTTISSGAEGTAVVGKFTGNPQGRSNLADIHGHGARVQYVPTFSPRLYCATEAVY